MNHTLPIGWMRIKLEEVVIILDNYRRPINSLERQNRIGYFPYYGATGQVGWIDDFLFDEELVLLGEDGAPFFDKLKSVAYIINGKSWVNNHAHVLKAQIDLTTNKYLLYYLNYVDYEDYVNGTTRLKLTLSNLKNIPFLLPPLAEQARIVAILDELMERIRSAREQLDNLNKIGNKLLRAFITNEDNESWPGVKLGDYCEEGRERIKEGWFGKRLIGVSKDEGVTDLRVGTKASFENYKIVRPGDFLYNPMRVDIGSIAIYDNEEIAITSPDYIVFRVTHTLSPLLLLAFLKSELGLAEINNNTQGSVRSRLYFINLCNINFPLGEAADQQQAQEVLQVFNEVERQGESLYGKLTLIEQGFLNKAFAGELTEQDPNDEPASALLERVRIERAAEQQKPKPKRSRLTDDTTPKNRKKMAEQLRAIKEILAAAPTPIPAHTVWQQSIHKNDIEAFYAELKQLVDEEQSVVDVKEGDQSYLTLANAH